LSRLIVTKAEFQELAEQRLVEARALLDQGRWDGAYYLAGYAVELALKACIIKALLATDAFPDKEFSRNCYTHVVEKLVGLAKLEGARKAAMDADPDLSTNWGWRRTGRRRNGITGSTRPRRKIFSRPSPTPYMEYSHG
jgi:hypothetical protein